LRPFLLKGGKSWLRYDEANEVKKAKVDKKAIMAHVEVASSCHALQPSLSFKKVTVAACMDILVHENSGKWSMTDAQQVDWSSAMTWRLRNMLHCIAASEAKQIGWTRELPWPRDATKKVHRKHNGEQNDKQKKKANHITVPEDQAGSDAAEEGEEEEEEQEEEDADDGAKSDPEVVLRRPAEAANTYETYNFGWNKEIKLAFRVKRDGSDGQELSMPPYIEQDALPTDRIVAEWGVEGD
jgi:hypothetical protein